MLCLCADCNAACISVRNPSLEYLLPLAQDGGHRGSDTQQDLQHFGQKDVDEVAQFLHHHIDDVEQTMLSTQRQDGALICLGCCPLHCRQTRTLKHRHWLSGALRQDLNFLIFFIPTMAVVADWLKQQVDEHSQLLSLAACQEAQNDGGPGRSVGLPLELTASFTAQTSKQDPVSQTNKSLNTERPTIT